MYDSIQSTAARRFELSLLWKHSTFIISHSLLSFLITVVSHNNRSLYVAKPTLPYTMSTLDLDQWILSQINLDLNNYFWVLTHQIMKFSDIGIYFDYSIGLSSYALSLVWHQLLCMADYAAPDNKSLHSDPLGPKILHQNPNLLVF